MLDTSEKRHSHLASLAHRQGLAGNKVIAQAIEKSAENIKSGDSLAAPLAASKHFPRNVVEMVAVGEESNNLEKVLLDISVALKSAPIASWICSSDCSNP